MKTAIQRISSLFLVAFLAFGVSNVALGADISGDIKLEATYTDETGAETVCPVEGIETPLDVPVRLVDYFVQTDYNGVRYKLEKLIVKDPDKAPDDEQEYTAEEIYAGQTYVFPELFYSDFWVFTYYTVDTTPPPVPAPVPDSEQEEVFALSYYKNIAPNEAVWFIQGEYEKGTSVSVTRDVPKNPGCKFLYWTVDSEGRGRSFYAGDTLDINADIKLYAQWETMPDTSAPVNDNPSTGGPLAP